MRNFIAAASSLCLAASCPGQATPEEAIREIDARIAALQREKARLMETLPAGKAAHGLFDGNGKVNPRFIASVIIIEGDKSVGTGFVARTEGKKFLYTAAHVLSGNSRLTIRNANGRKFEKFGDLQAAEGADLVRLEILEEVADFLELAPAFAAIGINTPVTALGNGGGNGVIALESGRILGTSGDLLEVDAKIIQGNSGGPVVETDTGRVVGEITHMTTAREDIWSEGARQGEVRRFACRLDKEWKWMTLKTAAFLADSRNLEEFDNFTRVCFAIAALVPQETGMRLSSQLGSHQTVASVFAENQENDLVKSLMGMNQELGSRKTSLSDAELHKKFRSLISQAESRASRTAETFKPQYFAWFHRHQSKASVEARDNCIAALKRRLEQLR